MGVFRTSWVVTRGFCKVLYDFFVRWFLPLHDDRFDDEAQDEDRNDRIRPFQKDNE